MLKQRLDSVACGSRQRQAVVAWGEGMLTRRRVCDLQPLLCNHTIQTAPFIVMPRTNSGSTQRDEGPEHSTVERCAAVGEPRGLGPPDGELGQSMAGAPVAEGRHGFPGVEGRDGAPVGEERLGGPGGEGRHGAPSGEGRRGGPGGEGRRGGPVGEGRLGGTVGGTRLGGTVGGARHVCGIPGCWWCRGCCHGC